MLISTWRKIKIRRCIVTDVSFETVYRHALYNRLIPQLLTIPQGIVHCKNSGNVRVNIQGLALIHTARYWHYSLKIEWKSFLTFLIDLWWMNYIQLQNWNIETWQIFSLRKLRIENQYESIWMTIFDINIQVTQFIVSDWTVSVALERFQHSVQ